MPLLALHPTADRMPESSLSWMLSWCIEEFGVGCVDLCGDAARKLIARPRSAFLREAERQAGPVGLLGTTAAFARLFDALRDNPGHDCRQGSRLMDTGGAKGQVVAAQRL